jgi:NAD(P)H-hydrate epimerase
MAGRIEAVEIGFPPIEARGDASRGARVITARWVRDMLRARPADAHKGTSGYLLLAAGTRGMAGAAVLAGRAAYRAGAGIVRVLGDPANREIIQQAVPGAVFESWDEGGDADANRDVADGTAWAHALAIGPGLGGEPAARALVERLLGERGDRPVVLDADGLNAFAGRPDALAALVGPSDVLTPHPGELARLVDGQIPDVKADPAGAARAAADRFGCVVVLKGTPTLVAVPGEPLRLAVTGGPAMAVGGTGDVLTGAIGAGLAGGAGAADAATVALLLTGLAAEFARRGDVGLVAEDIPDAIPAAREEVATLGPRPTGALFFALDAMGDDR